MDYVLCKVSKLKQLMFPVHTALCTLRTSIHLKIYGTCRDVGMTKILVGDMSFKIVQYRGNFWMPNSKNIYIGKLGILSKLGGVGSSPFTFRRPCRWHHTVSTLLYNEDGSLWGIAASQVHKIWTHFEKMSLYIEYLYLYCYVVRIGCSTVKH